MPIGCSYMSYYTINQTLLFTNGGEMGQSDGAKSFGTGEEDLREEQRSLWIELVSVKYCELSDM